MKSAIAMCTDLAHSSLRLKFFPPTMTPHLSVHRLILIATWSDIDCLLRDISRDWQQCHDVGDMKNFVLGVHLQEHIS